MVLAGLLALAGPALTACIPAPEGEVAPARTADGDLMVHVAPCHGVYDTVTLERPGTLDENVGSGRHEHAIVGSAGVDITRRSRSEGWTTLVAWDGELVPGDVYRLRAEHSQLAEESYALTIDSETVDYLRPGELLTRSDGDGVQVREESVDDWSDRACDDGWL